MKEKYNTIFSFSKVYYTQITIQCNDHVSVIYKSSKVDYTNLRVIKAWALKAQNLGKYTFLQGTTHIY